MGRSREGLDHRTTLSRFPPRGQQIGNDRPSGDTSAAHRHGPSRSCAWAPLESRLGTRRHFWFWVMGWNVARRLVLAEPSRFRGRTGRAERAAYLGTCVPWATKRSSISDGVVGFGGSGRASLPVCYWTNLS